VYTFLSQLDRRWIFLLMFLAVGVPILVGLTLPESPSDMVRNVYDAIENLPEGSNVLLSFDFDPASSGELEPMAAAFTRHCAERHHKLYFMTLWSPGVPMVQNHIETLREEYPDYQPGRDYVDLGYKPGGEGVIKVIVSDLRALFVTDARGTSLAEMPITKDITNIQQMQLIISVSAGTPGAKEWVQYAATPYNVRMVAGSTGVQTPGLYPYIPRQLAGVLGAIKAAAEYEYLLVERYPSFADNVLAKEGLRRMGPQSVAHMLMILLIVVGNVLYFIGRRRGVTR